MPSGGHPRGQSLDLLCLGNARMPKLAKGRERRPNNATRTDDLVRVSGSGKPEDYHPCGGLVGATLPPSLSFRRQMASIPNLVCLTRQPMLGARKGRSWQGGLWAPSCGWLVKSSDRERSCVAAPSIEKEVV
jgi:hypothetical protein